MELIREIMEIESETITIKVPKELRKKRVEILVLPLELANSGEESNEQPEEKKTSASGLCGIWEDDRTPDEIIDDIYSNRTGFGDR